MTKQRIVISSLLFIFILTTCSFSYITFSKLTSKTEDIKTESNIVKQNVNTVETEDDSFWD